MASAKGRAGDIVASARGKGQGYSARCRARDTALVLGVGPGLHG